MVGRPLEDWGQLLGDTAAAGAILDRFLHHAEVTSSPAARFACTTASNGARRRKKRWYQPEERVLEVMATSQRASWDIVEARFRLPLSKTRCQAAIIDRFSRKVLTQTVSPVTMSTPTQVAGFDLIASGWFCLIGDSAHGQL